ncbi:MAG: rhodanese-like domain-containing protein [Gammaproteobacteria bacterium]
MDSITAPQLQARIQQGDAMVIIDVREPWEYEICNIVGARNLPMERIPEAIHDLDPTACTVVVCHHGMRSWQVAAYLERAGFAQVANLEGGVDAWALEVDPRMARY